MTTGEMLFYGGITGAIIIAVISIIVFIILCRGKKVLRKKFHTEIKK